MGVRGGVRGCSNFVERLGRLLVGRSCFGFVSQ